MPVLISTGGRHASTSWDPPPAHRRRPAGAAAQSTSRRAWHGIRDCRATRAFYRARCNEGREVAVSDGGQESRDACTSAEIFKLQIRLMVYAEPLVTVLGIRVMSSVAWKSHLCSNSCACRSVGPGRATFSLKLEPITRLRKQSPNHPISTQCVAILDECSPTSRPFHLSTKVNSESTLFDI